MIIQALYFDIYTIFRVELPDDFSPWDVTVEELVDQIEQMIEQEPIDTRSDDEIRYHVFDEIVTCLAKTLGRDKNIFQLTDRFHDVVPWYQRGKVRKGLMQNLDKKYSSLFSAQPGCVTVSLCFLAAALCGTSYLLVFDKQPNIEPFCIFVALACYIVSVILMNAFYLQPFSRLPYHSIGDAVDSIVKLIKVGGEFIRVKYKGNREAVHTELLQILSKIFKRNPKLFVASKLKEDFINNYN